MIHFLFGGKSCGRFSGAKYISFREGSDILIGQLKLEDDDQRPEVGSHFDVVPADAEQWSKEKNQNVQKQSRLSKGEFS